jgi:hypothetical protein
MINRTVIAILLAAAFLGSCVGRQQPRAYVSELTSDDSMTIRMGQWQLMRYHSQRLGFDINYPSFLVHQELPDEVGSQEIFMMDDISISIMTESTDSMLRSPSQQLMGMGADLTEVTDRYSIQEGADEEWEYFGKVIDDSTRLITVMLRYYPEHTEAVEPLKEWVRAFDVR